GPGRREEVCIPRFPIVAPRRAGALAGFSRRTRLLTIQIIANMNDEIRAFGSGLFGYFGERPALRALQAWMRASLIRHPVSARTIIFAGALAGSGVVRPEAVTVRVPRWRAASHKGRNPEGMGSRKCI